MIRSIRKSKVTKVVSSYLALQLILTMIQPTQMWALTSGPSQPEFNAFTPIGTSDMVSLSSGDFNYNIPIMDVGGYPLNLAYASSITMDQEASWVGLGWNLNVGQITRNVRGLPDDFNGDEMRYENNLRDNVSMGVDGSTRLPFAGIDFVDIGVGVGLQINNYDGLSSSVSLGPSFRVHDNVTVGMQLGGNSAGGATASPSISIHTKEREKKSVNFENLGGTLGITYDSNRGLSNFNISASRSFQKLTFNSLLDWSFKQGGGGFGGNIPLNDYTTFTPRNQLKFNTENIAINFGFGIETPWTFEGIQFQTKGWGSIQRLAEEDKDKRVAAFGYENTENAAPGLSILDFNREKDRVISPNTNALSPVIYTYDTYQLSGQGLMGNFRAHRNKVGNVFDETVSTSGLGGSVGFEVGAGGYLHTGLDIEVNPSSSVTERWSDDNPALDKLTNTTNGSESPLYEPYFYKMNGEVNADQEYYTDGFNFYSDKPLMIGISSGNSTKYKRKTRLQYQAKDYNANGSINYSPLPIEKIKRQGREDRSSAIQKFTHAEAANTPLIAHRSVNDAFVQDHHTAGYIALQSDGSRYVYGETVYNINKVEATFAVDGNGNCADGLVSYTNNERSTDNEAGRDHYLNRTTTPAYAHSFLLTSILSKDYEDLTNDGPSPDDLGNYTLITYDQTPNTYNWRVPLVESTNTGSFNRGLNTDKKDQKANYIFGQKELKYVRQIETKTHVAIFERSERKDALGAVDQHGQVGFGEMEMQKLDKIKLFTQTEFARNGEDLGLPLKTVHFEYDYHLTRGVANNDIGAPLLENEIANQSGKLTLKKLYFTYQNSKMGVHTPYNFNYAEDERNPLYNLKGYDVWGTYKENKATSCDVRTGEMSATEFPFTEQNKALADQNATSWFLESIDLPSGGKLSIEQESDDYNFVQDRRAMAMVKVVGAGDSASPSGAAVHNDNLFSGNDFSKYLYVQLPDNISATYTAEDFKKDYLRDTEGSLGDIGYSRNNMLHFRFLMNMTKNVNSENYDYVSGYTALDGSVNVFGTGGNTYVALPLKFLKKEGGLLNSSQQVNPLSKAGWYFARKNLNRQSYGVPSSDDDIVDFGDAARSLFDGLGSLLEILGGPNDALKKRNIASKFVPEKSWIRLYEPTGFKYGGGARVKRITLDDQWDAMAGQTGMSCIEIVTDKSILM